MSELGLTDISTNELPCRGELTIKAIDRNGNTAHIYETPNTIVYDARDLMSFLLVGDNVADKKISKLGVGLDGTPPARTDGTLGNELIKIDISNYTFPESGHVEITAVLDYTSAANGQVLQEAGLFSADGTTLFARQIFGEITKSNLFQLQFIWRIIFT